MTIFEMLDRLEAGVLSLLPAAGMPKSQAVKKRPAAAKKTVHPVTGQPELAPVSADGETAKAEAARILGKRQALGRSLVHLRKLSVTRNEEGNPQ